MPAHKNEHRDAYIAMIVGGIGLIIILLWLFGPSAAVAEALPSQPNALPSVDGSTPGLSDYNYNIAPYNPGTPIQYAFPSLYPSVPATGCGCGGNESAACGPVVGASYTDLTVSQWQTLVSAA